MKKILLLITGCLFSATIFAAGGGAPIKLEKVKVNTSDKASVMRGAKFFAAQCQTCHTMRYLQHNKLAAKAGVTLDKMPLKNKEWWLNVVPPDLTLIARVKGADWLYTYFHSFYKDSSRPTGYNNLLSPNVNMMNIFAGMQGEQVLTKEGKEEVAHAGWRKMHYYNVLEMVKQGSMTPAEFNATMTDLVNFMVYASDPQKAEHQAIGYWVLGFLVFFFIIAYMLKKAYWKKVK